MSEELDRESERQRYRAGADKSEREAAALQDGEHASRMRERVYAALVDAGERGLTDHELHDLVDPEAPDGGPRNRRVDLTRAGLVTKATEVNGETLRRPSRSGATSMTVWRALAEEERLSPPTPKPRRLSGVDILTRPDGAVVMYHIVLPGTLDPACGAEAYPGFVPPQGYHYPGCPECVQRTQRWADRMSRRNSA